MRQAAILTSYMLRLRRRSLVAWTLSVTIYLLVMILVYTSIGDVDFTDLLNQYPEELKNFFGIQGNFDFSTAIGYLNVELFSFVMPLALAFLPVTIASSALAAAEDQRHLDVLLGAPVPRRSLLLAVFATSAISLAVLLAIATIVGVLFAWAIGVELSLSDLAEACAAVWPLALLFGAIAILTAAITPHRGRTVAIASGVLIAMYLGNGLAPMVDVLDKIDPISAFKYYAEWGRTGLDVVEALLMTLVATALVALAIPLYDRRDIQG